MAKGFAAEFHRTAFVRRNAHWKSVAMVRGKNAKGQPDLFQPAVATDSSRLCFGVGKGANCESPQHDSNGNGRDQFNPCKRIESATLVEPGHISQGIANRFATQELVEDREREDREEGHPSAVSLPSMNHGKCLDRFVSHLQHGIVQSSSWSQCISKRNGGFP